MESYTVYWNAAFCRPVQRYDSGAPLEVIFGGPHISMPSLTRAGVVVGDVLYPIRVFQRSLYVLASMTVDRFLTPVDYARDVLHIGLGTSPKLEPFWFDTLREHRPDLAHRLPHTCVTEAAIARDATAIRFDRAVPSELLGTIRYRSQRGERAIKFIEDGRLMRSLSVDGVYRLSPHSAELFARLIKATPRTNG